jgi:hypothetical protein
MKSVNARHTINSLLPLLSFLSFLVVILLFLFGQPCVWVLGDPPFAEHCGLIIDNQTGEPLSVTPINTDGNTPSAVRLYRSTFPTFPVYQQRNIAVKSSEQVSLLFDCEKRISELYVCEMDGECYLYQSPYQKVTISSFETLTRPSAALGTAVKTFPEYNYSGITNGLLCIIQIIALFGWLYLLKWVKVHETPKYDV